MTIAANPLQLPRGFALVRRIDTARTTALGLCFVAIGAVFYQLDAALSAWFALALYCLAWPQLAAWLATRAQRPYLTAMRSVVLDNFMLACSVPAMAFNVLPSAVMLVMLAMSVVAIGDRKVLLRAAQAQLLGIAAGLWLFGGHWAPLSMQLNVLTTLPLIVGYPLLLGAMAVRAMRRSEAASADERCDVQSGLLLREHWLTLVSDEFERCVRMQTPASLIIIDIDRFSELKLRCSADESAAVIRRCADLLRIKLRDDDRVGRYGEDKFGLLLPDTSLPLAVEVAERLHRMLHQQPLFLQHKVTASFGVAELQQSFIDYHAWLQCADAALYTAKRQGRDRVVAHLVSVRAVAI